MSHYNLKKQTVSKRSNKARQDLCSVENPSGDSFCWLLFGKEIKAQLQSCPAKNALPVNVPATSSVAAATATAAAATGVADDNDDAAVHKVPPRNWRRVQGMFCVCFLPCVMFITYPTLNG
jgi:hypothetical protein